MHGDYEAQRHWMEITTQLPISQWYFHDLEWWGLDYPPLTAYHSWLCGKIGALINPSWFALHSSRALEDPALKIFMRATVIVSEYLIFIPAAVIFVRRFSRLAGVHTWDSSLALVAILMQPATILIDHVHFQYNTVMLGFVLASMSSLTAGRTLWACIFFVLALGFKQMALYYAPAIFAYLLGSCLFPRLTFMRLILISLITLLSFALLLAPLLLGSLYDVHRGIDARPELFGHAAPLPIFSDYSFRLDNTAWYYPPIQQTAQLLFRVFPFARGLFEDKVANFWCVANVVYKLKNLPGPLLQRASLLFTLIGIAPPCLIIFFRPRKQLLPWALSSTAFAFFLFSFQVHEKSILLPLLPLTVLFASGTGMTPYARAWIGFFNLLGAWTMFPLLSRVDLRIPYFVLTGLWAYLLGLPPTSLAIYTSSSASGLGSSWGLREYSTAFIHLPFYAAMLGWHVVEAVLLPPSTKPDLWVVANVAIGAAGFVLAYLWSLSGLIAESGILSRMQKVSNAKKTS
jgi:alpha-1,3-glucosyltransferase